MVRRFLGFSVCGVVALVLLMGSCENSLLNKLKDHRNLAESPVLAIKKLDGTAVASGGSVDFGSQGKGGLTDMILTLTNTGKSPLSISKVDIVAANGSAAGGYSLVESLPASLAVDASVNCAIHFFAASMGNQVANLTISSNDVATPAYTVKLLSVVVDPPTSPTGLSPFVSDKQVKLSWNPVEGATSYNLYWQSNPGVTTASGTKIRNVSSPYLHLNLTNGATYYYVVTALIGNSESLVSNEISAIPNAATYGQPTSVSAVPANGAVTVTWAAPLNGVVASSYNVYYSSILGAGTSGTKLTGTSSPYSVTGLINGTTYYFVVTAMVTAGSPGEYASSQVSATPLSPPGQPAITGSSFANNRVTLTWSAPTGTSTSYNVYRSSTGSSFGSMSKIATVSYANLSYADSGFVYGVTNYYAVAAVNAGGESVPSAASNVLTLAAPTGLSDTPGNGTISLSWSAVPSASSYNVYWANFSGVTTSNGTKVTGATSPRSFSSLTNGLMYYYIVTAVNGAGESLASAEHAAKPNILSGLVTTRNTELGDQAGIATDGTFVYVTEVLWNRVSKINIASGQKTTLAGSGSAGSNNASGTLATFYGPCGLATDGVNLYVADTGNNMIRKIVISSGAVSTLAGSTSSGSADGFGAAARFDGPVGVATDGTYVYVSDQWTHLIRKIVINTGEVTTLAGSGSYGSANGVGAAASFYNPRGLATDGTNLYVADFGNNMIRKIVISSRVVTTLAGSTTSGKADGAGSVATFNGPWGLALDGNNLFVADDYNNSVRQILLTNGVVVTTLAGSTYGKVDGAGTAAKFRNPCDVAIKSGTSSPLFVADAGCLRKIE